MCGQADQMNLDGEGYARHQRCRCMNNKELPTEYAYETYKVGVKDQIVDMTMNGSSVRGTMRVVKVGINTVIRTLKSSHRK